MREKEIAPAAPKLRAFRKRMRLTQAQAAAALDCSGPTFNDWENGKKRPSADRRADIEVWTKGEVSQSEWLFVDEHREVVPATERAESDPEAA